MRNKFFLAKQDNSPMPKRKGVMRIMGVSLLMLVVALTAWQCREDDFTGEVIGICPEVIATNPANGAINVISSQHITATFNQEMEPSTINETTFLLNMGSASVAGTVGYSGVVATFTPTELLQANVVYTATIKRASMDLMGNIMVKDTTWQFNTGAIPDIISTDPVDGASGVALNTVISAEFSTVMNESSINASSFVVMQGATVVTGALTYAGTTATFTPSVALTADKVYTVTINTQVEDLGGYSLATDKQWSFTTLAAIAQFTVSVTANPLDGGIVVGGGLFDVGSSVTVTATANSGFSFDKWTENGQQVSTSDNYTFSLTDNRALVANFEANVANPLGVDLGSAAAFVVLAGTGISNIGISTLLTGDVGSFPSSTINGLLSGNVIGTLFMVADPIVGLAKTDLTTAYNDAQGRSIDAISLPGQLGGLTLAPGLYVNSSTSGISGTGANGILTLDAGGNPNAVWIFKMGSTLVTDAGTSIVLAGGAQAKNIYWSVGTSATLGTNSIFFGTILADQSITLTTGASLTGRALARIGAVTLDTNIITKTN
jgi:hypothetical protein